MKVVKYLQNGGPMTQQPTTGQPAGGEDVLTQLADVFAQGLQSGDCNMLAQGAQMFLQLVSQAMGEGGPQGPVDQVPAGEPVFKKGGKLVKRRKCSK